MRGIVERGDIVYLRPEAIERLSSQLVVPVSPEQKLKVIYEVRKTAKGAKAILVYVGWKIFVEVWKTDLLRRPAIEFRFQSVVDELKRLRRVAKVLGLDEDALVPKRKRERSIYQQNKRRVRVLGHVIDRRLRELKDFGAVAPKGWRYQCEGALLTLVEDD